MRFLLKPLFVLLLMLLPSTAMLDDAPVIWFGTTDIAQGGGEKGPWEQNNSRFNYVDDPTVAFDREGQIAIAWVDQARKDVFFRRASSDDGKLQGEPVNVSRSPETFSWLPRISTAPNAPKRLYVVWQEIIFSGGSHGGDILFARSDNNGATFSRPVNISNSTGGDGKGRINAKVWDNGSFDFVAGPNGAVYVAWTEYDGALWFSQSVDAGRHFSRARHITGGGDTKPARAPSIALRNDGMLFLAWTTGDDDHAAIQVARSTDRGASFAAPQAIAPQRRYADAPKLAIAPDGVLHLVYAQSDSDPFARFRIYYTRSQDDARSFEVPREIAGPFANDRQSARYPALGIDAAGRLFVLYERYSDYRQGPRGLGISVSFNGGKDFFASALVPDSAAVGNETNGSHQGLLMKKMAVHQDGRLAIVNSSLRPAEHSRVWLLRGAINPLTLSKR